MAPENEALDDLLSRLESASEGSRELDEDIARYLSHADYEWWRERVGPSEFTRSIDSAISLVPEGYIRLERYSDGWYAAIKPHSQDKTESVGTQKPAALAICIAAMKALRARRTTLAGEE